MLLLLLSLLLLMSLTAAAEVASDSCPPFWLPAPALPCPALPPVQLVVFEGCGHMPQEECPERFVQTVQQFVASLDS